MPAESFRTREAILRHVAIVADTETINDQALVEAITDDDVRQMCSTLLKE
jgi:hypothetical protein